MMISIRLHKKIVIGALLLSVLIPSSLLIKQSQVAADTYSFDPGRIIDDAVFTNSGTMNVAQIQAFLNSKVPVCDTNGTSASEYGGGTRAQYAASKGVSTPFTCLKDYTENGRTSAQIIYDTAQQYSINPEVLLTLLQKEQGLVTDAWPWPVQYQKATGYGCPDNAPCDSQYYGLTNQLTWSAKMYHAIMVADPNWYTPYLLGSNYIQYSPTTSCGGSNVTIQNRATQALYNYTPYQPNAAVLAAPMGATVNCGAYGNINFFRYFTQWFGSTTGPDYAWESTSAKLYYDAAHTQEVTQINGTYYLTPGQKAYAKIITTNIGRATWPTGSTHLGTQSPQDHSSPLADSSWLSPNRPATFSETSAVVPNSTATFTFSVTAPQTPNMYYENYAVVVDGVSWATNTITSLKIAVPSAENTALISTNTSLPAGSTLQKGQTLVSPETHTALHLTGDGNLEVWTNYQRTWTSSTNGSGADRLVNDNGNLILYKGSTIVWSSGTSGPNSSLSVQSDGNVVLYSNGSALWSTGTMTANQYGLTNSTLLANQEIFPGQTLSTPDRYYRFSVQGDGNIVEYTPNHAVWTSGTYGQKIDHVVLQGDGNLVAYDVNNSAVWSTHTSSTGGNWLELQPDGNTVLYITNRALWATNTFMAH